jgi:uncharacterized DUF497 family protein
MRWFISLLVKHLKASYNAQQGYSIVKIAGLIWLQDIVEKLWYKHHIEQQEVREVLTGGPHFRFVEKVHRVGENVYSASGQTDAGRYAIVFFVYKQDKRALIVSARDMTDVERRRYERG